MKLVELLERHYFLERDIRDSTRLFLLIKVGAFGRWLGRPPLVADLNSETVNTFIAHRLTERARETVRGERAVLRALWQFAFDGRLTEVPPQRIRPLKRLRNVVEGWDESQVRKLLDEAGSLSGRLRGHTVLRRDYWRAVVRTVYDTGLRAADLLNLKSADVAAPGPLVVVQAKTRQPVETAISADAVQAIAAIRPNERERPFAIIGRRSFFEGFAKIAKSADLTGRARMLRRTSGSLVERDNPGSGHLHLGNGRSVFERHYNVPRLSSRGAKLPPRIE
jgi:integrase